MMKKLIPLIAAIFCIIGYPSEGFTVKDFPVCYWRPINKKNWVHRGEKDQLTWRKIRKERNLRRSALGKKKLFELRYMNFLNHWAKFDETDWHLPGRATILIRDPDGRIRLMNLKPADQRAVKLPEDERLNGRYLLGAHCDLGEMDINDDGRPEVVHLYTKHLVMHYNSYGRMGTNPDVFLNDVKNMPFEIGPVLSTSDSSFYGGIQQRPHHRYKMMVRYLNKPLPNVKVTVMDEDGGWQRTFVTDHRGIFEIRPFDDRPKDRRWQRYLYVAAHDDVNRNTLHIATLTVSVPQNQPEWLSQFVGFTFWSILGSTGCFLLVIVLVQRKRRLQKNTLLSFENYKIKKD